MSFRISALEIDTFRHLFGRSSESLAAIGIQRMTAETNPGYPCRVSLQDADIGESVLLMNFEHQPANSPYRSAHAIFVREDATQSARYLNEIPDLLKIRLLSVRSFNNCGDMLDADVCDGVDLEALIDRLFADSAVDYLHVHNARRGCFLATVERT